MTDQPEYWSMPDPCPHIPMLALTAAKLYGGPELEKLLSHLDSCPDAD